MSDSYNIPDMCLKSFVAGEREKAESLLEQVEEPKLLKDEKKGGTLLHWAARWGWYETVKKLVEHYTFDPMVRSNNGSVPLLFACLGGCLKTIQYLIEHCKCDPMCRRNDGWTPLHSACAGDNVNVRCVEGNGWTPLHSACAGDNVNVVKYLITQCRCDPMCKANNGMTPLHSLCRNCSNLDVVCYLIEECKCDPMRRKNDGWTPLHFACAGGNVDVVKYLITQCECDPMCKANNGWTPLHSVCGNSCNLDVIFYLTEECKCDPMCRAIDGWTPLHSACAGGNVNVVKYLITQCRCDPMCKANNGWTPLHSVCRNSCNLDVICYLIEECKCDPMCRRNDGWTPLHSACAGGNVNVHLVKYLITQCRCDPMCKANDGWTPLHSVCGNNCNLDVICHLIEECKCDPMYRAIDGWTSLHSACARGNVNVVKYLITQCRCDPMCKANNGWTPLHSVCHNSGNLDVICYLIEECKCDPICRRNDGWTPLHSACAGGNVDVVKYLIKQYECDPMCKANDGMTPLHLVCRNSGNLDLIRYLIEECNCDPMCKDKSSETPLHLACRKGYYAIAEYLFCNCAIDPSFRNIPSFLSEDNMIKLLYNKFSKLSSCLDIESYIKIFLLGDSGVGKTTLTEVIKQRANGVVVFGWLKQVSGVELHTAGINTHRLEHKELGNIILHDLAGQPEYYSSHIAVLENFTQGSAAVFIVVVKLSEDAPYNTNRWLSLVKDLSSRCSSTCYVLTVASHADSVDQSLREQFRHKLEDKISSFLKGKRLQSMGTVSLDCRKLGSRNFTVFKHFLSSACQSVRNTLSHKKMQSCDKMYCQMLHLLMETEKVSFYTTDTLLKLVRESSHEYLLPETEDKFLLSLYHLHCIGLLMFINTPGGSWVVFEKQALLSEVIRKIFASSTSMISNTG